MAQQILLIDDDASLRRVTEFNLQEAGYHVLTARDGSEGLVLFKRYRPPLVITDVQMPGMSGYDVLKEVLTLEPQTLVIIVTAFSTVVQAVEAMKDGAHDYLAKPFSRDQLSMAVAKAFEYRNLQQENRQLKDVLSGHLDREQIIGESKKMQQLLQRVEKIASSQAFALISGESGTGKEVIAKALHRASDRSREPFIAVNCAAIPKDLIESELFGHLKGSFTGAIKDRKGKFSLANGGTLFLDEIGELPIDLQPKLLRALQEQQIEPVGGTTEQVDVRVIAATNRNLEEAMRNGTFREDLYYRLAVVPIEIPPLRERKEDIPALAHHFLKKLNVPADVTLTSDAIELMKTYHWPGNIRELQNVIERSVILRTSNEIRGADLNLRGSAGSSQTLIQLPREGHNLIEVEKQLIKQALSMAGNNQSEAARLLSIPRHVLLYRLEKYNLK